MAPRGLSAEEKRVKMLEILHDSKDFYQLKELERLGPKLKGIVSQTVKEVVQSLVDDNLMQMEKIGASNFFWSFPSQHGAMIQGRVDSAKEARSGAEAQIAELNATLEAEKVSRVETDERVEALEKLSRNRKELGGLEAELGEYGACDPVKVEEKRRALVLATEAARRWTENYSMMFGWLIGRGSIGAEDLRKYLEVDDEYEDI